MQLSLDAADRLVDLVHEQRGPVPADDAARTLFALDSAPVAIARSLLEDVVAGDARLAWRGERVGLADPPGARTALEDAELVVFDLETTGLSAARDRICEIGAVRVRALAVDDAFETLVATGAPLPPGIAALTGIDPRALRSAPQPDRALSGFLAFAGDAPLVAHNARFDLAFLDRAVERRTGRRVAAPVVDTVWLARRLLDRRAERVSLAWLAHFFGTSVTPCHRALADAQATAEILVRLIGLAQERGAETVADLVELSAPRARRLNGKRPLVAGAPSSPGVYRFLDANGTVLYVGRARDLRARLRSYFSGGRQRPAVEAALGVLASVEWTPTGSELEAALDELRVIGELRPPANARATRPDRYVYLDRRKDRWVVVDEPGPFGPLTSRRKAALAARALDRHEGDDPSAALPELRHRLRRVAAELRFEDAARLRDRIAALEEVVELIRELDGLRTLRVCVLAPALEPGLVRAFFVAGGRVSARRTLLSGPAGRVEVEAGLAEAARLPMSFAAEDAAELLVLAGFLRRPGPELRIVPLEADRILAAA
jgi:DNA polymerase III epsilon subunit family exonuclease